MTIEQMRPNRHDMPNNLSTFLQHLYQQGKVPKPIKYPSFGKIKSEYFLHIQHFPGQLLRIFHLSVLNQAEMLAGSV